MCRSIIIAVLFYSLPVNSQVLHKFEPSVFLRTNPTSFLERDAGVMLGVSYHFERRLGVTLDPTYIFYSLSSTRLEESEDNRGIKIRSDIRYYGSDGSYKQFFFGPEFHYKYVRSDRWTTFGIDCIQGNCAYYQYAPYVQTVNELGISLKGGIEVISNNRKWMVELFAGLGFKYLKFREKNIPPGGSFSDIPNRYVIFGEHEPGKAYPIIPGGLKLAFRIR